MRVNGRITRLLGIPTSQKPLHAFCPGHLRPNAASSSTSSTTYVGQGRSNIDAHWVRGVPTQSLQIELSANSNPGSSIAAPNILDTHIKTGCNEQINQSHSPDIWIDHYGGTYSRARKNAMLHQRNFKQQNERFSIELLLRVSRDPGKAASAIIRAQISQAKTTTDILRIVAVTVQKPLFWNELKKVQYFLLASLYRMRAHETDTRILTVITIIFKRFKMIGIDFSRENVGLGLAFAARARSLPGLKLFLSELRSRNSKMPAHVFRSLVSKFSIGTRGFGQIRNGSWKRDELRQVLLGLPDMQGQPPCHLETFVNRTHWGFIVAWIAVLAFCQARKELRNEWELWRVSELRLSSKPLMNVRAKSPTVKVRGDRWFIEQFLNAGDPCGAWNVFENGDLKFDHLRPSVKQRLLESVVYASVWTLPVIEAVEQKIDEDLADLATALIGEESMINS